MRLRGDEKTLEDRKGVQRTEIEEEEVGHVRAAVMATEDEEVGADLGGCMR